MTFAKTKVVVLPDCAQHQPVFRLLEPVAPERLGGPPHDLQLSPGLRGLRLEDHQTIGRPVHRSTYLHESSLQVDVVPAQREQFAFESLQEAQAQQDQAVSRVRSPPGPPANQVP